MIVLRQALNNLSEYGARSALTSPPSRLRGGPQPLNSDICNAPVLVLEVKLLVTFMEDDSLSTLLGIKRWKVGFFVGLDAFVRTRGRTC